MSGAGGAGGEEGGKEASNRGRGNTYPRRRVSVMVYSRGNATLWPIDQWLAIIVSSLEQHVSTSCRLLSLPTPLSSPASALLHPTTFSIFHSHPPPAVLGRSHRDPTLPSTARVRKPLLAKLKLRHSARNAETI